MSLFERLMVQEPKKPVKKVTTPVKVNVNPVPTAGPTSTSSPRQIGVNNSRTQFYSSGAKVENKTETPTETTQTAEAGETVEQVTEEQTTETTEQTTEETVQETTEAQPTEETTTETTETTETPQETVQETTESTEPTTEVVSTTNLVEKFQNLDKQAAESVPAPIRPSDDHAFTPVRISSAKLASSGENIVPKSKTTAPQEGEWRGSLFDRLMSTTPTKVSTPRESKQEEYTQQQAKKRVIDFASKQSALNFSAEVIKHFEELSSEEAGSLDYNYFTFTYDFENNKKDVVFLEKGRGLDQFRAKLDATNILHAVYRVELVVRSDLPRFVKYFLLTWTGEQLSNIKRAHATTNVTTIESFFECAFVTHHVQHTGPELVDDLERALSKVAHEQTLW